MRTFQVGVLLGLSPGIWLVLSFFGGDLGGATAAALSALHGVGALIAARTPRMGKGLISATWGAALLMCWDVIVRSPLWALVLVLGVGWLLVWLWNLAGFPARSDERNRDVDPLLGVSVSGGLLWFGSVVGGNVGGSALWVVAALGWGLRTVMLWRLGWLRKRINVALWAAVSGVFVWVVLALLPASLWTTALLVPLWVTALRLRREPTGARVRGRRDLPLWWALWADPARHLVTTFLLLGLAGGFILSSPLCAAKAQEGVPLLDAMFTAFSAACVTGLGVLDTPNDFSWFGQAMILVLIQVGGLGIMTFSTAGLALLGKRLSLQHEATLAEMLATDNRRDLNLELKRVLLVTLAVEGAGAGVLTLLFVAGGEGLIGALWRGIFTSISAFCNAGFALQSDSLMGFQQNPAVLHTVGLIIIAGSFGPAVIVALPSLLRGRSRSLQAKVVWRTTLLLLLVPAALIWVIETPNTLSGLGWFDALSNAWFQSVTLRTAGFNSLDIGALQPATITLMMAAMFVGGSPGSTAGGIKTTSLALLFASLTATLRGLEDAEVMGFRLPRRTVLRAAAIAVMGVLSVFLFLVLLLLTQSMQFLAVLFEAISALATVGLSMGATAGLDSIGKVLIIAAMFAGRVGPLTLMMFLTSRQTQAERQRSPEQDISVG